MSDKKNKHLSYSAERFSYPVCKEKLNTTNKYKFMRPHNSQYSVVTRRKCQCYCQHLCYISHVFYQAIAELAYKKLFTPNATKRPINRSEYLAQDFRQNMLSHCDE